ncbi:MAG: transketolase [Clostridia bacterium]|nr:transketolase, N-terminal subunit [Clostridiales bacterium]MDK2985583.1 transketolase [Clostridia bacterium]
MDSVQKRELQLQANQIRQDIIKMTGQAGSGHPGGSLSGVEILTVLYNNVLKMRPNQPDWPDRDRFILSKGHAAPLLYAVLASKGYFPREELWRLRKLGSMLQGHPDLKTTPGVEMSTGSLGQGFSVSIGMALAGKLDKKDYRVYVMLGDGESQEGIVWEAAMAAAHYKLDNICAVLDYNGFQIDGTNSEVMSVEPVADKWRAFGWHVIEIDGHDLEAIAAAFQEAQTIKGKPTMIVARTIKGKGVSFMENEVDWHGKATNPTETEKALAELQKIRG